MCTEKSKIQGKRAAPDDPPTADPPAAPIQLPTNGHHNLSDGLNERVKAEQLKAALLEMEVKKARERAQRLAIESEAREHRDRVIKEKFLFCTRRKPKQPDPEDPAAPV